MAERQGMPASGLKPSRPTSTPSLAPAGASGRHRVGAQGSGADLDHEAGDGEPGARPHRIRPQLCELKGYRSGDNPARWRGHLENLLPSRDKVRKVVHHPALAYAEIGPFMVALREDESSRRAPWSS